MAVENDYNLLVFWVNNIAETGAMLRAEIQAYAEQLLPIRVQADALDNAAQLLFGAKAVKD